MQGLGTRGWGLAGALGAVGLAVSSVVVSGFSRTVQTPAPQPPTFRTEANYVRVDIYPTRDEKPVTDLTQADFEILEGGVPQKLEQFEHVAVHTTPAGMPVDPNTIAESRAQLETTRGRVFVIFLDVAHVTIAGCASRSPRRSIG
jgi:hypothetical protein